MAFANITAKIRRFKTHIIKKHLQENYPKASAFLYADYLKQKRGCEKTALQKQEGT